jgi:hypothetical protein
MVNPFTCWYQGWQKPTFAVLKLGFGLKGQNPKKKPMGFGDSGNKTTCIHTIYYSSLFQYNGVNNAIVDR